MTVDVTGTRFRVDWNPGGPHSFGIELKEGSVIVGGDCLPTPRRVQRGDNLRITCGPAAGDDDREGGAARSRRLPSRRSRRRCTPLRPSPDRDTHVNG